MGRKSASKQDRVTQRRQADAALARPSRPSAAGGSGWLTRPLAITLAAAALFRVAYLAQYAARSVFAGAPILDAAVYFDWARAIAAGQLLPATPFYFAPGYAYALAALFTLTSASLTAVSMAQALCGLVDIVLVHRLAALAYGRHVAAWAAALTALYAAFPFLETKALSATLGLTLSLLLLVALASASSRPSRRRWLGAGLLGGAAALVRPETMLLLPLAALWVWRWGARAGAAARPSGAGIAAGVPPAGSRASAAGRPLLAGGLVVLGWAVGVAPVAVHNLRAGGGLTLISSQAGLTFYQGNNPRARGLYVSLEAEGFSGEPQKQAEEETAIAGKALGRPVTRAKASSYWLHRGLAFITEQPARYLRLEGMKLLRFVSSYEYSTEYVLAVEREAVWLLRLPFVPFGLLFALAVPAVALGLRRRAGSEAAGWPALGPLGWLLLAAFATNLATCLIFYVSSRYRLAAVPSLIVFAAVTVVTLLDAGRRGERRRVVATAAVIAALLALASLPAGVGARLEEANVHFNAGTVWVGRGDQRRAAAEFQSAATLDGSRFQNWFNLASSLAELGRWREAADAYGRAASLRPDLFDAHAQQGLALMEVGDWEGARAALEKAEALRRNVFDLQMALGRVDAKLGRNGDALDHYDRALAMWPTSTAARQERDALLAQGRGAARDEAP